MAVRSHHVVGHFLSPFLSSLALPSSSCLFELAFPFGVEKCSFMLVTITILSVVTLIRWSCMGHFGDENVGFGGRVSLPLAPGPDDEDEGPLLLLSLS